MSIVEEIIYGISDRYGLGWGVDAELSVLHAYIENQDSWEAFEDFVMQVAQEEAIHNQESSNE